VEISGLESEVQCIRQQVHETRPFPVPDHHKVLQTAFSLGVKWASVGRGAAPCHWQWHQGQATRDLAGWTASQLKLRGKAPEPDQTPLMQFRIEVLNHAKSGSVFRCRCQSNPSSCCGPCHVTILEQCKAPANMQPCLQAGSTSNLFSDTVKRVYILRARVAL
jgi:hypothetical protein